LSAALREMLTMQDAKKGLFMLYQAVGTCLYSGYAPVAPGTAGSALCAIIFWLLPPTSVLVMLVLTAAVVLTGVQSAGVLAQEWGRDPGKITIDEFAGMMIALTGLPHVWWLWILAFLIFRAFDILKPPPIRTLEYLPAGWGIVADDVLAGIYTAAVCRVIIWIL